MPPMYSYDVERGHVRPASRARAPAAPCDRPRQPREHAPRRRVRPAARRRMRVSRRARTRRRSGTRRAARGRTPAAGRPSSAPAPRDTGSGCRARPPARSRSAGSSPHGRAARSAADVGLGGRGEARAHQRRADATALERRLDADRPERQHLDGAGARVRLDPRAADRDVARDRAVAQRDERQRPRRGRRPRAARRGSPPPPSTARTRRGGARGARRRPPAARAAARRSCRQHRVELGDRPRGVLVVHDARSRAPRAASTLCARSSTNTHASAGSHSRSSTSA